MAAAADKEQAQTLNAAKPQQDVRTDVPEAEKNQVPDPEKKQTQGDDKGQTQENDQR